MEEKQYPGYNERWTNCLVDHPLTGVPAQEVPLAEAVEVKEEPVVEQPSNTKDASLRACGLAFLLTGRNSVSTVPCRNA